VTRRWGRDPFRTGLVQAVEGSARQALASSATPGLAVALVHHGQTVLTAGYGVADRTTGQPVTAATCFQAASLSKPVTAWGVLRLVEQGRIGLDEPIVGRLRRWRLPPSPFDGDGVTVRRLLSHTAGLSVHGYVGQTPDRPVASIAASLAGETGDSFPVELLEAPGRGWLYSGGGYSLLQLLVEELTGSPFADYMQTEVLEPLGMTASSFRWSRTAQTARPYDADGRLVPDFVFAEQAAAGLVTTAPDLARFLAAALAGPRGEPPGRGVLSPAGVRLALTAAPATDGRWGLGYGLGLLPDGDRLAYHEGANRGWRAGLALLPDRRAGIALLANGDDGNAPIDAVVQHWLGLATPNPKRARGRAAMLGALAVVAVVATATRRPRSAPAVPSRQPPTKVATGFLSRLACWWSLNIRAATHAAPDERRHRWGNTCRSSAPASRRLPWRPCSRSARPPSPRPNGCARSCCGPSWSGSTTPPGWMC
jgi:CubicO group peptidase (beta-lactamase class C family)